MQQSGSAPDVADRSARAVADGDAVLAALQRCVRVLAAVGLALAAAVDCAIIQEALDLVGVRVRLQGKHAGGR